MKNKRGIKRYRAAIVGCGRIGSEFDNDPKRKLISTHAGAYSAVEDVELVAVCDLDETKLKKCMRKWHVPSGYRDYRKMLSKEDIDILSICTWNHTHLEIVKKAVRKKVKAIFCEKPIADTLKSTDKMIRLCNENGILLQIDHQRRFDKMHQLIRDYIQKGRLGKIQHTIFYYTAGIANTGSHMFDILRFFFGDVVWVKGIFSKNKSPNPKDPNIDGILKFKNDMVCSICACDAKRFLIFEMDAVGQKGRIRLIRNGASLEYYRVKESDMFTGYKELFKSSDPLKAPPKTSVMIEGVRHLVGCLDKNKKSVSNEVDGKRTLELICAMIVSARNDGRRVRLPLSRTDITIGSQ